MQNLQGQDANDPRKVRAKAMAELKSEEGKRAQADRTKARGGVG